MQGLAALERDFAAKCAKFAKYAKEEKETELLFLGVICDLGVVGIRNRVSNVRQTETTPR